MGDSPPDNSGGGFIIASRNSLGQLPGNYCLFKIPAVTENEAAAQEGGDSG
jgi:hypothetical protein